TPVPRLQPNRAGALPVPFAGANEGRPQSSDEDETSAVKSSASPTTRSADRDRHWYRLLQQISRGLRNNRSKCLVVFRMEPGSRRSSPETVPPRGVAAV